MSNTIEVSIKSINELQKLPAAKLLQMSLARGNRQYALACGYLANAMNAHALGDTKSMWLYVERAKLAHTRAMEDERGQARRMLGL